MFALIVRLARAFNLDRESLDESTYLREARRRLWHNIVVMDIFFALDRGSEPLITPGSFSRPLPSNVNDVDFDRDSVSLFPRESQVTDMTFALVTQQLSACIHRINFPDYQSAVDSWQQRLHAAEAEEKAIEDNYLRFCDPSNDFHRLIIRIARVISTSLSLRAVRPMQRDPSHVLPSIDSPWVFELAVNTLRRCCEVREDTALVKWKQMPWVQWHPLAVVLAGLCSSKIQDSSSVNEAWQLVDQTMDFSAKLVADTKRGSLWQPIEKLYKRAVASKRTQGQDGLHVLPDRDSTAIAATSSDQTIESSETSNFDVNTDQAMKDIEISGNLLMDGASPWLQMDNWLDWDSLIADWDAVGNGSNVLWA